VLPPGVVPLVQLFEMFSGDMGVDLSGSDIGMAQHHLDRPQVCPPFQKVRGKGMSQGVGRKRFGDPSALCIISQPMPESLPAHLLPGSISKQDGAGPSFEELRSCTFQIDL